MERYHRRLLHRWLASRTRRLPIDAQRCHILCDSPSSYRGRLDWLQPHDGRQHETRCSPAASHRPRTISERWWRRRHGSSCIIFRTFIHTLLERTIHDNGGLKWSRPSESGRLGCICRRPGLAASGVRTLLTLCYTCIIHATMVITTSGGIQTDAIFTSKFQHFTFVPLVISQVLLIRPARSTSRATR
jgi:hypothetical protein